MFEKTGFYPVILDTSRQLRLPFSVMQFGWTETMRENEYNFPGGVSSCEFCFRLESEESEVLDWVDGTLLRSALPHCLVKFPGVPYRYRSRPGRRVFFLNYPPQARAAFEAAGFDFSPPNWEFRMTGGIRRILAEFDELGLQVQCRGVPERIDMLALQLIEAVYLQSGQLEPQSDEERRIRNIASALHAGFAEAVDFDRPAARVFPAANSSAAGSTIIQFLPGDISNICGWKPPAGCCSKPAIRLRKSLRNPDSRMSPILSGSSTASTASRRFSSVMVPESDIFRHVFLIENGAPRTILINGRM